MTWTRCTVREAASAEFPDVAAVSISKTDDGDTRIEFHMVSDGCGGVPIRACVKYLPELVEHFTAELEANGHVHVPVSCMEDDDDAPARPN
jgi:hypothetical protein